jgi:hypothetical protein
MLATAGMVVTGVAAVAVKTGRGRLTTSHSLDGARTTNVRSVKATIQDSLDGHPELSGDIVIGHDFKEGALELSEVPFAGDGTANTRSRSLKVPWLGARLGRATADHALGVTGSEGTRNTTNVDTNREVIKCNEGSQRPVGAAAEKRRTNLRAHRGCCSGGLSS